MNRRKSREGNKGTDCASGSGLDRRRFLGLCGAAALTPALQPLLEEPAAIVPLGRVVMIRNPAATNYNFNPDLFYGDFVDQEVVDRMMDEGVMALTGEETVKAAWQAIIPGFVPGRKVAIKVNFNNCGTWELTANTMNGLIQPVNAVVRGLLMIGVRPADIRVYDSVRILPRRFVEGCLYQAVEFWDPNGGSGKLDVYHNTGVYVNFDHPDVAPLALCNVVTEADWLINMPILKRHPGAGITLSFKNHFGTIENCGSLHYWVYPTRYPQTWSPDYNPLVDIGRNPHIRNKTVLVVGDGLFGDYLDHAGPPLKWANFPYGTPNALFLSRDMVAADSVMHDVMLLEAPDTIPGCDAYLPLAEAAGLGVFEHGDPIDSGGYEKIDFLRIDQRGDEAVAGTVLSDGKPVGDARVYAEHEVGGGGVGTRTDFSGRFSFERMLVGRHRLTARKKGFRPRSRSVSYSGRARTVNFRLRPK